MGAGRTRLPLFLGRSNRFRPRPQLTLPPLSVAMSVPQSILACLAAPPSSRVLSRRPRLGCLKCRAILRGAPTETRRLMATGTVKWFNATKGYGFIMPQDGGRDVFVHITAVQSAGLRGLNEGQKVTYEVAMERGKASATNLRVA